MTGMPPVDPCSMYSRCTPLSSLANAGAAVVLRSRFMRSPGNAKDAARMAHREHGRSCTELPRSVVRASPMLQGQQILHQVRLLIVAELEFHASVVVIDHVRQGCKTAVMIEAAFLMRE